MNMLCFTFVNHAFNLKLPILLKVRKLEYNIIMCRFLSKYYLHNIIIVLVLINI